MSEKALRIVFFGTPDFSVPTLRRLLEGPHSVVGVVSQPDRARGRGRRQTPSPVSQLALEAGLELLRPERVGAPEVLDALAGVEPDLGVVAAFGQFLPKKVRQLPRCGYLINVHASLLPRHRGAAPIAHAILAGDSRTGVSIMRVEKEMDAGPIATVGELEIGAQENAGELTERLAELGADLVERILPRISSGRVEWTEQDHAQATTAPKITREDARLGWRCSAESLVLRVRAMAPSPGATTAHLGEPLRILAAHTAPGPVDAEPGSVRRPSASTLQIATSRGWLVPTLLQRAGGRAMDAAAYLRGRPIPDGARLDLLGDAEPD
ncbi:MAG: methionyl-tRNA formyltransferase [Proteobacteria bacterium]|nr:methionyl-tRNA formyltransferase [Pseudomonadota bacterium]